MALDQSVVFSCHKIIAGIHPDVIAGILQFFEQACFMRLQQVCHGAVTVDMGIQSGLETAPARYADRILAESIPERNSFAVGEAVQEWRNRCWISQMRQGICTHLVRIEDYDIWSVIRHVD